MKRIHFQYIAVFILVLPLFFSSCKKVIHPANPTPDNYRLLTYTKTTPGGIYDLNENYRFYYNSNKRVSQITRTSNDTNLANYNARFTYINDTIYKTISRLEMDTVLERDTFIQNGQGQITLSYTPGFVQKFEYLGKLLTKVTKIYYDSAVAISSMVNYFSDNGDFRNRAGDGTLTANFYGISAPLKVSWYTVTSTSATTHNVSGLTDMLTGYTVGGAAVTALDAFNNFVGGYYWGAEWPNESYGFFTDHANRPGDYLHIGSFTTFGVNIYENAHLVNVITTTGHTTNVVYTIDGDSKIKQTFVSTKDSANRIFQTNYKLDYEQF